MVKEMVLLADVLSLMDSPYRGGIASTVVLTVPLHEAGWQAVAED